LGEGKPENQNHAIIFTRGEGLQTIDMNQVLHYYLYIEERSEIQHMNKL
jgi:callose synthase